MKNPPSIPLSRATSSNRISHSPAHVQTRSLSSIRACIARCNKPSTTVTTKKRTTTESIISPPPTSKRRKNEYDLIEKYLHSFSKEINEELKEFLEEKLHENLSLFIDRFCSIINELLFNKCNLILLQIKKLHPYEESIQILLKYINSKSLTFQQSFIQKLNQSFEFEIKQQSQISHNRIQILK